MREDKATISSIVPKLPAIPRKFCSKETFKWFIPVTCYLMFGINIYIQDILMHSCQSSLINGTFVKIKQHLCILQFVGKVTEVLFMSLVSSCKIILVKVGSKFGCFLHKIPFPFQINLSPPSVSSKPTLSQCYPHGNPNAIPMLSQ